MPHIKWSLAAIKGVGNRYLAVIYCLKMHLGREEEKDLSGKDRFGSGTSVPDDADFSGRYRDGAFSVCCTACEG